MKFDRLKQIVQFKAPISVVGSRCLVKIGSVEMHWWGWSQWYKWRWFKTHLDMGLISFYGIPEKGLWSWPWRILAVCCKPMRKCYQWFVILKIHKKIFG